jgi:CBS-domain-containing membrane protein
MKTRKQARRIARMTLQTRIVEATGGAGTEKTEEPREDEMHRTHKLAPPPTAADLMNRALVTVPHRMTLRGAAKVLARWQAHVLAVTDDRGQFAGMLSAADLLGWVAGDEQNQDTGARSEWHLLAPVGGRNDEVRWHLAANPAVAVPSASLFDLAWLMHRARTGWVVILDEQRRPIGVVSAVDLLAADWPRQDSACPRVPPGEAGVSVGPARC